MQLQVARSLKNSETWNTMSVLDLLCFSCFKKKPVMQRYYAGLKICKLNIKGWYNQSIALILSCHRIFLSVDLKAFYKGGRILFVTWGKRKIGSFAKGHQQCCRHNPGCLGHKSMMNILPLNPANQVRVLKQSCPYVSARKMYLIMHNILV